MMSAVASKLFCSPKAIGEKAKLKIKLSAKGRATLRGIFFFVVSQKTIPKVIKIIGYKIPQTKPKISAGGAKFGLTKLEYQLGALAEKKFILIFKWCSGEDLNLHGIAPTRF